MATFTPDIIFQVAKGGFLKDPIPTSQGLALVANVVPRSLSVA